MTPDQQEQRIHGAGLRAMVAEAAAIRHELRTDRGLQSCSMCGRTDPATASDCPAPGVCEWVDSEGGIPD